MSLKSSVVRLLPAPAEDALRRVFNRPKVVQVAEGEKSAEWYDRAFEEADDYSAHYSASSYYPSWTVILDRVRRAGVRSMLEVACGPGQLACALRDSGLLDSYQGFDFAEKRIAAAKLNCPQYKFHVADAFTTDLFESVSYDVLVATEFLEHVTDDLKVIERIRAGARFIGTVPNYPYVSHVRHFTDTGAVHERYGMYFDQLTIAPIVRDARSHVLYLMEGIKRA